jgi:hypothetical protein
MGNDYLIGYLGSEIAMQIKKEEEQKDKSEDFDAGFKIPETKTVMSELDELYMEALREEHKEEMEQDEKEGKPKKKRRGGVICICGAPGCGIGPMQERQGQDAE